MGFPGVRHGISCLHFLIFSMFRTDSGVTQIDV